MWTVDAQRAMLETSRIQYDDKVTENKRSHNHNSGSTQECTQEPRLPDLGYGLRAPEFLALTQISAAATYRRGYLFCGSRTAEYAS